MIYRYFNLYVFYLVNAIDVHYLIGLKSIDNLLSRVRVVALKNAGASIGQKVVLRAKLKIVNPRHLTISSGVTVGSGCKIMNFASIEIGLNTEVGPDCTFQTNEHLFPDVNSPLGKQGSVCLPIRIGSGCYIGLGVTFLSGVKVCDQAVVGARSLVNKDIEKKGIYGGVPCRILKTFTQ